MQPTACPELAEGAQAAGREAKNDQAAERRKRGQEIAQKKTGRLAPPRLAEYLLLGSGPYGPSLPPARCSSCSGVSRSILIPIDSSFSFATRLSSSSGTR